MTTQYINTREAAKLIGVTIQCIRQMIGTNTLHAKRIGRDWMVTLASAERASKNPSEIGRPRGKKTVEEAEKITS